MLKFTKTSCLSEGVYRLICGLNLEYTKSCQREDEEDEPKWMEREVNFDDKIQSLETVAKLSLDKNLDGSINFVNTVKQLIPFCHNVHKQLMQLTTEQFSGNFGMDMEWTGCKVRIVECFELLKKGNLEPVNVILSSLLLFSILEHALGDIYISYTGSKQCPSNLKDLIISKEIQELLGENVSSILYVLAGPPEGANLRNVLWHGFVSPMEIPPQYASFLLFMLASISSRLACVQIERRPMIKLSQLHRLCVFPNIESNNCIATVDQLFTSSLFITPSMLPIWKKALRCYEEKRYGLVIVLLLPQLEHALRRVFAYVNKCTDRILTAESTTLYTTFDEILAASLPDGSDNQLRKEIGDEYLQMLLDILVYTQGPRIRDHISHGELNLDSIPFEISNHVLCICIAFASLFTPGLKNKSTNIDDINNTDSETTEKHLPVTATAKGSQITEELSATEFFFPHLKTDAREGKGHQSLYNLSVKSDDADTIQQIILKASSYHSVYHPTEILRNDIKDLSEMIKKWDHIPVPETELGCSSDYKLKEDKESMLKMMRIFFESKATSNSVVHDTHELEMLSIDGHFSRVISLLCNRINVPTLYRPRKELEVVSLFSSIVQHCSNMSCQVMTTANQRHQQWSKKELRSRQRTNYKRLLSLLPFFQNVLKTVLVFILIELPSLPTNIADDTKACYIKFLKRCLQSSENLESLSSSSKNKWEECKVVGEQLMHLMHKHFS